MTLDSCNGNSGGSQRASEVAHENPYFRVLKRTRSTPTGDHDYFSVRFARECVAAAVIDRVGRVAVVNEYREALGRSIWDLPAGVIDDGESPLQAGQREASEELGVPHDSLSQGRRVATYLNSPGSTDQRMHFVVFAIDFDCKLGPSLTGDEHDIRDARWFDAAELAAATIAGHSSANLSLCHLLLQHR